jgi:hypothetical protein
MKPDAPVTSMRVTICPDQTRTHATYNCRDPIAPGKPMFCGIMADVPLTHRRVRLWHLADLSFCTANVYF